jgi:hypothetical protein
LLLVLLAACYAPVDSDRQRTRATQALADPSSAETTGTALPGATIVEGDMVFAGTSKSAKPWPNGVVFYTVAPSLTDQDRVNKAIAHWESRTPIRFVKRTTEPGFVSFIPAQSCYSTVGFSGVKQDIGIGPTCAAGNIIHLLGHAVGLLHEHNRSDRDQHIHVALENVAAAQQHNFDRATTPSTGTYDVASVMHYGSTAFSSNGQPTLTTLDGKAIVPQRNGLSYADIDHVKTLYDNAAEETPDADPNPDPTPAPPDPPPKPTTAPSSVHVSWNKKSKSAAYSLDIILGATIIGPCVNTGTIGKSLSYTFNGTCTSPGINVNMNDITDFRICWAENDDWANGSCAGVAYDKSADVKIPN